MDLAAAELEMAALENREAVLKNALAPIRGDYDFLLIDCPPSLGLITTNALTAADTDPHPHPVRILRFGRGFPS